LAINGLLQVFDYAQYVGIREVTTYTARVKQRKNRTNYNELLIQRKSKPQAMRKKTKTSIVLGS
jgi:hypothetical protein